MAVTQDKATERLMFSIFGAMKPAKSQKSAGRLGVSQIGIDKLISMIRAGLPYTTISQVTDRCGLEAQEIHKTLGIASRTIARRNHNPKPLDPEQSEKLLRIVQAMEHASEVLEDETKALEWIRTPNISLNAQRPLDMLDTGIGFERVMNILRAIEFGVYT